MSYPATTPDQARALLSRPEMASFSIDGRTLTAKLVEAGMQPVLREVDGKARWVEEQGYEVVFEGGKWGAHSLRCSVSSPERILAHWDGYKVAHQQDLERRTALRAEPAGQRLPANVWKPKVGDRCFFRRGMFGAWAGRIIRLYPARGSILPGRGMKKGTLLADIACRGANGRGYTYKRVVVSTLTHGGLKPYLPEEV